MLYAGILFTNAFVGTLFAANGVHNFYMTGMRAKIVLISAVYRKSLLLSNSAKRGEMKILFGSSVIVKYLKLFCFNSYILTFNLCS